MERPQFQQALQNEAAFGQEHSVHAEIEAAGRMASLAGYPVEDDRRNIAMGEAGTDENRIESIAVFSKIAQLGSDISDLGKWQDRAEQGTNQDKTDRGDGGIAEPARAQRRAIHHRSGTIG